MNYKTSIDVSIIGEQWQSFKQPHTQYRSEIGIKKGGVIKSSSNFRHIILSCNN